MKHMPRSSPGGVTTIADHCGCRGRADGVAAAAEPTVGHTGAVTGTDVVRRRVLVSGRVQGVFFRDSCRRVAVDAGVRGWARNLDDGRVEVVAEGGADAVDAVVSWCREGPPRARVDQVAVDDETPTGLDGF